MAVSYNGLSLTPSLFSLTLCNVQQNFRLVNFSALQTKHSIMSKWQGSSFQSDLLSIPIPTDKILGVIKMKAFADDVLNLAKMTISLLTLSQTANFRLLQIQRVCRRQL